jgi:hypothetical protein
MLLDTIHRLVYFLENNVSETGFCLRPQVKPTQLDPIDRASPYLYHRHKRLNKYDRLHTQHSVDTSNYIMDKHNIKSKTN